MGDQDLRDLFAGLDRPVPPDPAFTRDLLRRVEDVLVHGEGSTATETRSPDLDDMRELTVHDSQPHRTRSWALPVLGVAAAAIVAIALGVGLSDDDGDVATVDSPTTVIAPADPVAAYAEQVSAAYQPFHQAIDNYFAACHRGVVNEDLSLCVTALETTSVAIGTFNQVLSTLAPPDELAADHQQLLTTATAIDEVLARSAAPAAADDRAALRDVNASYGQAYTGWCESVAHFNSLTPDDSHLRADLAPSACGTG